MQYSSFIPCSQILHLAGSREEGAFRRGQDRRDVFVGQGTGKNSIWCGRRKASVKYKKKFNSLLRAGCCQILDKCFVRGVLVILLKEERARRPWLVGEAKGAYLPRAPNLPSHMRTSRMALGAFDNVIRALLME